MQVAKKVVHYKTGEKLMSEYYTNGKKSHSTEIDFEVALALLNGPGGDRVVVKEQTAEDDNNFWKNPVNQQEQIRFNETKAREKVRYGGHISYEELAKHNSPADAWIAVEGRVYDVTKYATIHPGGKKINLGFGKDATDLFKKYHSWVNTEAIVGKCYIGLLE